MNIIKKVLVLLVVSFTIICYSSNYAFATGVLGHGSMNKAGSSGTSVYDAMGEISAAGTDSAMVGNLNGVISKLLGFLQIASGLMAIIMIAWTGFRYIIETPDMKAELKKTMIPIIVGALLVFGAVTIAKFIIGLVD